jgi:hypothetical protein
MNADAHPAGPPVLPEQIVRALRQLIRRARHLIVLRGVCASCAAGVGAFLAIMLVDASFTLLARWPRWLMSGVAYAVWAGAFAWFLLRPLARSFTLAGIARLIEAHHPELQERLSSVVELLGSRDVPAIRGSEVLIGALTEEAVRDAVRLKPRHEISFRSAIPFAVAAGIVIAVLAALWLARPLQMRFLLARAAAPFLNLSNVHAADLVVEPGDALVASGSPLRISVRTANPAVTSARLRQWDRQGRELVTDMVAVHGATNQPGRSFSVTLPGIVTGFRYRIHAGDALTRYFTVRVAIPPIIEHLEVRYRYPEYSRLGVRQERDGSRTIRALAGSEVTVSATVNKPVSNAAMVITTAAATNILKGVSRSVDGARLCDFSLTLPRQLNGSWSLVLTDEIGLSNAPFDYAIQSIPDNPPVTAVVNLRQRELHLNRDSRLPVAYSAEDDLGLTGLAVMFAIPGVSNETSRSLPLPGQAGDVIKAMHGETQLAMDDPLFTNAPRVSFRVRATDNLPGTLKGPQFGYSETYTIIFDDRAASWKEQVLASQEDRVQQGLKQVQQKLASARTQAHALEAPLAQQPTLGPETARKIDALQDSLATADNSLREMAADIDKGFFAALATNLEALAEDHVAKAEKLSAQLRLMDRPAERTGIHSNVTAEIETSLRAVEDAIKDHEVARRAVRRAVELDRLAEKQAELAQARQAQERGTAAPASNAVSAAEAAAASNAWQKAQNQVAEKLATLTRETPGTPEQVASATSNLAVQAARQATELAARQDELAALTREQTDRLQNQDRDWHDLANRQTQLASLARREPLSAPQEPPMRQAADDLAAGHAERALQTQADVAAAMRKESARLEEAAAPALAADDPGKTEPRQVAAEALQKADDGVKQAQQAAQRAEQAAARAQERASADAALVKRAEAAKKPELVRELTAQAAESVQAAKEAKPWSQAAAKAAEQARQAAAEARRAAEVAGRKDQPEPARREAANQAVRAADAVEQHADEARAAAHQAAARSAENGSLQERAVQAEERAQDAEREARQAALKAGVTARQAQQDAAKDEERAGQAAVNGAPLPQVQAAQKKAADARARAEAAGQAAAKSGDEARQARREADAAQQATDKALGETAPKATREHAEAAEASSAAAQQAARRAEEQARLAEAASQSAPEVRERAAQAAQKAAKDAAQAEQAAAAAQKAAKQMSEPAAEARRLAAQAWATGQNDLAKSTGRKSMIAREQAEHVQALADTAQKLAGEARQAATESAEAAKPAAQADASRQAQQAEDAARQAAAKADAARGAMEQAKAAAAPKPGAHAMAEEARQAERQAQDASQIAQQAAASAQQAAQKSAETAQQAAQQASASRQAAQQAAQAVEQAAQQARLSGGKPDEAEKTRQAGEAQENARLAQQNEAGAQRAAQEADKSVQQTQQAAQRSQQAAQGAQQAALAAQQAAQRSRQAATTATPQAAHQAKMETEQAALAAIEKAEQAVQAAGTADQSAEAARDRLAAQKLTSLAAQQEGLRRQVAGLLSEKAQTGTALQTKLAEAVAQQQQSLAADAAALAGEVKEATTVPAAADPATRAADATKQAAAEWTGGDKPAAQASAGEARRQLDQLAAALRAPASETAPAPLAEQSKRARLAQRSEELASRQDQLGGQMKALAENRSLQALQGEQERLSRQVDELAQSANTIRAQAEQVLARTPAGPQAGEAARAMAQAAQTAEQAAHAMQEVAEKGEAAGAAPSEPRAASAARTLQQAAEQTRQGQQGAAQNLKQAAQNLQNAARTLSAPAVSPATPARPAPASAAERETLAQAYQDALQAAASQRAADAVQTATQLARAAEQAAAAARELGADARPATLEAAASAGGGQDMEAQASEDVPSFARRLGIKLQDWLRLHGELKEDVLQASGSEGPEEYRPLIKGYFREVSGHGGEE